jgi:hypothetical protein
MDSRALSWIHLVPTDASICAAGAPDELLALLGARADRAGDVWLGWEPARADLPALERFRVAVLVRPRGISPAWLRAAGFPHIRSFAVVPGLADARWFVSLQSRRAALRAWDLYTPFRRPARLQKLVARLLTGAGAVSLISDRIVLAQRDISTLEQALAQAMGTRRLCLSIASGTPGPRRKLTIQIATPEGLILAYAKCADRPEAGARIRQEVSFREYVRLLGLKRTGVPGTLYHSPYAQGYLMISAPLPRSMAPSGLDLGRPHLDALRELAGHLGARPTGQVLDELRRRVARLAETIGRTWHDRLARAVALVAGAPGVGALATALSHGDFAPWNLRIEGQTGRLALLDWEHGQREQLLLWDAFHFHTQVDALVRRSGPAQSAAATVAALLRSPLPQELGLSAGLVRALYLAYLADASARWFEERSGPKDAAEEDLDQSLRGQVLDAELAGRPL